MAGRGRPRNAAVRENGGDEPSTSKANGKGANLGFEAELFRAADKLRGNMEPSDYKHVALGLVFLKGSVRARASVSGQRGLAWL
jgi:type I restriction enzyme M protein